MADLRQLDELQAWLLRQLETELRTVHPRIAADFEANPPRTDEALRAWAEKLTFPPVEPWISLCQAALSVKLGVDEIEYTIDSLGIATSGRAAWFHVSHSWISMHSVLERLQFLVRKMSRGKRASVSKKLGKKLDSELQQLLDRPPLGALRHSAAHGPQQHMEGNWFGAPSKQRLWELIALNGEDAHHLPESFYDDAFPRVATRHKALNDVAQGIVNVVERICRELLVAATRRHELVTRRPGTSC